MQPQQRPSMGPPPNVKPAELWTRLTAIPRPSKEVDFPRFDAVTTESIGRLVIWPLSQNEQMACNAEADKFAKRLLKDAQRREDQNLGYDAIYANEVAVQILFRACRDVEDPKRPLFPTPVELREKLTADEVGALFALYCAVQAELGPIIGWMTDQEMEEWVTALVEGSAHVPFSLFSLDAQLRLVNFMASRVVKLRTASSSAGSQPLEESESSQPPDNLTSEVSSDDPNA